MTYEACGEKVDVSGLHRVDLVVAQQLDSRDPTLDPSSGHFSTTSWFAAIKDIKQRFPSEYPLKPFGLSFRNLKAYGYVTASDHQPTFGTYPLRLLRKLWPTSSKSKSRVDILRSIDGIVDQGEMLLVLGRPGSGCTTLLKALAGESRGFSVGHDTHINYQGRATPRRTTITIANLSEQVFHRSLCIPNSEGNATILPNSTFISQSSRCSKH
jgi:hypothetical protein